MQNGSLDSDHAFHSHFRYIPGPEMLKSKKKWNDFFHYDAEDLENWQNWDGECNYFDLGFNCSKEEELSWMQTQGVLFSTLPIFPGKNELTIKSGAHCWPTAGVDRLWLDIRLQLFLSFPSYHWLLWNFI